MGAYSQLFLVIALSMLSVSSSATSSQTTAAVSTSPLSNVPFYLEQDKNGNTIAVIYYGEKGDISKEMEVPCSYEKDTMFAGPGSVLCRCTSKTACALTVPFQFVRDDAGAVIAVSYEQNSKGDIMIVPFHSQKDANGNTIGAVFDSKQDKQRMNPEAIAITVLLVVLALVMMMIIMIARYYRSEEKSVEDDATVSGSCVDELEHVVTQV